MSRNLIIVLAAAVSAGCATSTTGSTGQGGQPQAERMTLSNVIPFDVAACRARPLDLEPVSTEGALAALLSLTPAFQECLLDPRNVAMDGGVAALGDVKVKVTVGETASGSASGSGLTEEGQRCLAAQVAKVSFPARDAGVAPVEAEVPVAPASGRPVQFGLNVASDVVGTVRLAQTSMCDCYQEIGTSPAPVLVARLSLEKDRPVEVAMEGADGGTAGPVGTCVSGKLAALTYPSQKAQVPYQFLLKNSYADGPTPGAQPALQYQQLEGIRAQRTADVLVAQGKRGLAAEAYDEVVKAYKSSSGRKAFAMIPELRSKCAAVVAADDGWIAALKGLSALFDDAMVLVNTQALTDESWKPLQQGLTQQAEQTRKVIGDVEAQKMADQNACPKER